MKKEYGWLLLVAILVIVLVIAYAYAKQSATDNSWTTGFYDFLSGKYESIKPVQ